MHTQIADRDIVKWKCIFWNCQKLKFQVTRTMINIYLSGYKCIFVFTRTLHVDVDLNQCVEIESAICSVTRNNKILNYILFVKIKIKVLLLFYSPYYLETHQRERCRRLCRDFSRERFSWDVRPGSWLELKWGSGASQPWALIFTLPRGVDGDGEWWGMHTAFTFHIHTHTQNFSISILNWG